MCRHLGYLGPPIALAELLSTPPHSLLRQSWAPSDMRQGGTINADGFGVGWYPGNGAAPVRYRRDRPLWTDQNFADLAATIHSGAFVAAIRSATVGMPVVETACAPFTDGRFLFSHNGVVAGWPESVADLARRLDVTELVTLDAPTDAALLWALLRRQLRDGVDPVDAVAGLVAEVGAAAPGSRLNLLLGTDDLLVATTWWHSLHVRQTADAVLLASEPLDDDPAWTEVPDRHLVVARKSTVDITPLDRPDGLDAAPAPGREDRD